MPRDTQRKRRAEVLEIERRAEIDARQLGSDPRWSVGTAIYWGEGAKTKRVLAVTNADSAMLRCFIAWVQGFHDANADLVSSLQLHEGNDDDSARVFWRHELHLPAAKFHKTYIKKAGTGHRKSSLPHGVRRVLMRRSADAWIRPMAWIRVLAKESP